MNIHDVNLNALSRGTPLGLIAMCLLLLPTPTSLHIRRNDPLHVEELLIVLTSLRVLQTYAVCTTSIGLLLDVLSRV